MRDWFAIASIGAIVTICVLLFYIHSLDGDRPVEHARATVLGTLSLTSAALVAGLSRLRSAPARWLCAGTVLLTVFLIQTPGVSELLHLQALHADDWWRAAGAAGAAGLLATWFSRGLPAGRAIHVRRRGWQATPDDESPG